MSRPVGPAVLVLLLLTAAPALPTGSQWDPAVAARSPAAVAARSPAAVAARSPAAVGAPVDGDVTGPHIVAAYPNPVASGDRGEYVVLAFPGETHLGAWRLVDDETAVSLPNATVDGRVALSGNPARARNFTRERVIGLPATPELANGGGTIRLVRRGRVVDAVTYRNAPEGELRRWTGVGPRGRWRPLGATDRRVVHTDGGTARVFVLPDSGGLPATVLREADRRILIAGYTFTSRRVANVLVAAARRGVTVRLLVDGQPVGGMTRPEARLLDRLAAAGIEVEVLSGPRARYEFHHAKYAVVDDRALVLTENWKPAGTGGNSSRGWGVVLEDRATAEALAGTFGADTGWRDARDWATIRRGRSFQPARGEAANGSYPSRFRPRRVDVTGVSVLVAPDNAERAVVERIDRADESVHVQQASIGGPGQPFLRAALRAARRGVRVRILVSGQWYVAEENRKLVEWLDRRAAEENLPLDARVADPRGRYGKVHAKGVLIDGETTVLGSLNWNNHSARQNREVAVVLESEAATRYFSRVFRADWRGGAWRLPVAILAAVLGATTGAVLAGRRIDFE